MLYQVFSRNNDINGNPYRLILVYDIEASITEAYESRSSMPNIINKLSKQYRQLPTLHLAPKEYNNLKKLFNPISVS